MKIVSSSPLLYSYQTNHDIRSFITFDKVCLFSYCYHQGPDFDDMSSFFPCETDDAIQYINLVYGAQNPKIVIFTAFFVIFCCFKVLGHFCYLASFSCHIFEVYFIFKSYSQALLNFPVIYSPFLNNYIIMVK